MLDELYAVVLYKFGGFFEAMANDYLAGFKLYLVVALVSFFAKPFWFWRNLAVDIVFSYKLKFIRFWGLIFTIANTLVATSVIVYLWLWYAYLDRGHDMKLSFDPVALGITFVVSFVLGVIFFLYLSKNVEPKIAKKFGAVTKNGRTDINDSIAVVSRKLNQAKIKAKTERLNKIYFGATQDAILTMDRNDFFEKNVQVLGAPGAGKGVLMQSLIYQLRDTNKFVFFDPKDDRFLQKIANFDTAESMDNNGLRTVFIDLKREEYQLDLYADATASEVSNSLIEGLNLKEKGDNSDVYQLEEQLAVREVVDLVFNKYGTFSFDAFEREVVENFSKSRKLVSRAKTLGRLNAIQGSASLIRMVLDHNLYIIFDESDETQKIAAKLIFSRLCQIKKKGIVSTQLTVFCDEFIHLVNKSTVNALGLLRSHGMNFVVAHQSLGDFEAIFPDVSNKEARQRVADNTHIKVVFKQKDDAKFWAEQTGETLYDKKFTEAEMNEADEAIEGSTTKSTQESRNLFETNLFLAMPDNHAVIFGVKPQAQFTRIEVPIKYQKREIRKISTINSDQKIGKYKQEKPVKSRKSEPENIGAPSEGDFEI